MQVQQAVDMDLFNSPPEMMALASTLLLFLLSTNNVVNVPAPMDSDDDIENPFQSTMEAPPESSFDIEFVTCPALHNFRLCSVFSLLEEDLGYWVKPRSTAWFSPFLLNQYDDERWISMFRMTKQAVHTLAELLKPAMQKRDTKYRLAIPVLVRVACTLFKLTHGCSLFICSEMFAMGRSTISLVLRDVVQAINVTLRSEISWPTGERIVKVEAAFQELCGLLGVLGAIDGTHVTISKLRFGSADYFYFKSGGYTLNCQAVVDSNKRFLDLFLGMPGSTNDSRMLHRSSLYDKGMHGTLWDAGVSFEGFSPYILGDSGYPLLPWLLVPHRGQGNMPVADSLFNRKLRRGRGIVENAFGILKQTFRELLVKSELSVTFLPDVITCCAILHNILLGQSHRDVERLLQVLRTEGLQDEVSEEPAVVNEAVEVIRDDTAHFEGTEKRRQLGIFLALQRTNRM